MKIGIYVLLAFVFLTGCDSTQRVSILQNKSYVAYVKSLNILSPTVCIKSNTNDIQSMTPLEFKFDIKNELKTVIDSNYSQSFTTEDMKDFPSKISTRKSFCLGNTLSLKTEVKKKDLYKMVSSGDIKVSIIDKNGKVITSNKLTNFVIGNPDGTTTDYK